MPEKIVSRRLSLPIRFSRSSSLIERLRTRDSLKSLFFSSEIVRGRLIELDLELELQLTACSSTLASTIRSVNPALSAEVQRHPIAVTAVTALRDQRHSWITAQSSKLLCNRSTFV